MKMDDIDRIGSRIKDKRKRMSLTITEMALYTGLSTGYLSNIERNQSSPTLSNLKLICEALGVSMTEMIRAEAVEKTVIRKKDMLITEYPDFNQTVRIINFGNGRDVYEFITIRPGKTEAVSESMHPYDESCTVLQGTLVVILDDERYVLNKEDSIYIKAQSRHIICNESEKVCESFWNYKRNDDFH